MPPPVCWPVHAAAVLIIIQLHLGESTSSGDRCVGGQCTIAQDVEEAGLIQIQARRRGNGVGSWFSKELFEELFQNRGSWGCTGANFSYEKFIDATAVYPDFANSGDMDVDKGELMAFLAQSSQETTGGWWHGPWGWCRMDECVYPTVCPYCLADNPCADLGFDCTCVPGVQYHGRGPLQLSYNNNYAIFSMRYFGDLRLLHDPSPVFSNVTLSYIASIDFWMSPTKLKPSCHDVITGKWKPSQDDIASNRVPGYGMLTNIINGGVECGKNVSTDPTVGRIMYYLYYAPIFKVSVDYTALLCSHMTPYPG